MIEKVHELNVYSILISIIKPIPSVTIIIIIIITIIIIIIIIIIMIITIMNFYSDVQIILRSRLCFHFLFHLRTFIFSNIQSSD